jgi:hypothetical protein
MTVWTARDASPAPHPSPVRAADRPTDAASTTHRPRSPTDPHTIRSTAERIAHPRAYRRWARAVAATESSDPLSGFGTCCVAGAGSIPSGRSAPQPQPMHDAPAPIAAHQPCGSACPHVALDGTLITLHMDKDDALARVRRLGKTASSSSSSVSAFAAPRRRSSTKRKKAPADEEEVGAAGEVRGRRVAPQRTCVGATAEHTSSRRAGVYTRCRRRGSWRRNRARRRRWAVAAATRVVHAAATSHSWRG